MTPSSSASAAPKPRILPVLEGLARRALVAQGYRSHVVDVMGEKLHVYDANGRGKRAPVVFLHGLGGSATAFAPVAASLLGESKRVVLAEFPGHGSSPGVTAPPLTPSRLYEVMRATLEGLLDEPHVVVGNSLGGATAIAYALARPKSVRGLFLLSPAGAPLPPEETRDVVSSFEMTTRREGLRFLDRVFYRTPGYAKLLAHEIPGFIGHRAVRDLVAAAHEIPFTAEQLARIEPPTVLFWGKAEKLLPPSALEYLRTHLPAHVRVEEPQGFGHCPQLDSPKRLGARLLEFLREVG